MNKIINAGSCYKTWTNDDLKVMCGYFKKKGYHAIPSRKEDIHVDWEKIENDYPENFMKNRIEGVYDTIKEDVGEMSADEEDNECNDDIYDGITSFSL